MSPFLEGFLGGLTACALAFALHWRFVLHPRTRINPRISTGHIYRLGVDSARGSNSSVVLTPLQDADARTREVIQELRVQQSDIDRVAALLREPMPSMFVPHNDVFHITHTRPEDAPSPEKKAADVTPPTAWERIRNDP